MSEQSGPHNDEQPDQSHGKRGPRKKLAPQGLDEFPVDKVFIGEFRDHKGHQTFYRLRVVDSYLGPEFSPWNSRRQPIVYARILNVTSKLDMDLVGHIVPVSLERRYLFGHRGPIKSRLTEVEMGGLGYHFLVVEQGGS